ncbi:Esterase YbfF [Variovorax sp. SRS16]|uniref:alpha/beta fold hydrolase n=1 Tax=Variovorax sp. SRS16 TaxID=282217 RepID=UPI00131951C2|nr:alpha/beta fold hydrolase [Variovorax sp. SRS16]VTU13114.1 Esterase YbfF [Variovorax sp. SRS16]
MPVQLAFEAVGDGPAVVILHGLFGAGRNWAQIAHALAADYRVYLPDARNHGASTWAETMSYEEMALDVRALIAREGLERPFIVGHSMGGKTAMALALGLEDPESIGGIAVIDIAPESYADQFSSYVSAMRHLDLAAATSRSEIRRALADSLVGDAPIDFLMQNLRRHKDRFDWRLNLMATAVCMRELCAFPEALPHARYDGPALFLAGAESDYVRPESLPRILELFPGAELVRIADAGHWVHADQPQALLRGLNDWLAEARALAPR